jgi:hypothetical protein
LLGSLRRRRRYPKHQEHREAAENTGLPHLCCWLRTNGTVRNQGGQWPPRKKPRDSGQEWLQEGLQIRELQNQALPTSSAMVSKTFCCSGAQGLFSHDFKQNSRRLHTLLPCQPQSPLSRWDPCRVCMYKNTNPTCIYPSLGEATKLFPC